MSSKKGAVAMDVTTSKLKAGSSDPSQSLVNRLAKDKKPFTESTLDKKMKNAEKNREKIIEETKQKGKDEVKKAKNVAKKVQKARKKGKTDSAENDIPSKELLKRTQMPGKKMGKK